MKVPNVKIMYRAVKKGDTGWYLFDTEEQAEWMFGNKGHKVEKVFIITENHIKETVEDATDLIANGNKDEALEKLLKFMWETLRGE